ncbi:MAG: hypothetical protein LBS62_02525 [Clostridiales bacterium]|jgi:flagellar M-ring protein FliF|nr:hypothetical protein [Clostridiales bacterium]
MQERLRGYLNTLLNKWKALERTQRIRLICAAAAVLVTLVITVFIATRPELTSVLSGQDPVVIAEAEEVLSNAGIKSYITNNNRDLAVDAKSQPSALRALSAVDLGDSSGFTYADALSSSGMGTTEYVKRQNFKHYKEDYLAQIIGGFDGVRKAKVSLTIPESNNYWVDTGEKATAGVYLETTKTLDKSAGLAIARFLSRSVEGLELENIEITDQNYDTIYSNDATATYAGNGYDIEQLRRNEMVTYIKTAFMPLFDETHVILNLTVDNDTMQTNTTTYTSPYDAASQTGVISDEELSKSTATDGVEGEPGLGENDQQTPTYQIGSGTGTATTDDKARRYLYNTVNQLTEKGVGGIVADRSSMSVTFYKYKKYDQKVLTDNDMLGGQSWDAYKDTITETRIPVEQSIIDTLRAGTGIENVQVMAYEVPVFYDEITEPVQVEQLIMFAILALLILLLAYGIIRAAQPDEVTDIEPEMTVDHLLAVTKIDDEKEAEAEAARLQGIEYDAQSEVIRQIKKFVNERPEAVAQLLRNWLNDEWE